MIAVAAPTPDAPAAFSPWERAALCLLVGLGCWLRCRSVTGAFLFGDEMHSLRLLPLAYGEIVATFDAVGSGLGFPLLQKLSYDLLGPSLLALRLPALLPALATLLLVAAVGRRLSGPAAALFATAILATNTMHVFYAHFGRAYGLVALLALVFVAGVTRLLVAPRPTLADHAGTALTGGLLPWVHLATTTFVVAVGMAAVLAALAMRARRARVVPLAATVVASLGVALALHAPAWSQVAAFVSAKQHDEYLGAFGMLDVATVLAGSRTGGVVALVVVPLAAALSLRRRGLAGVPLVTAALAPLPLVFLTEPFGDPYAYARYAIAAVPAAVLLLGTLLADVVRRGGATRAAPVLAVVLGLALHAAGPSRLTDDGPYANTYLGLVPLPAFDVPAPTLPAPYASLEPGATIIETPALPNRSRQLYRNYYLQHRHPTLLGYLPQEGPAWPGPHVAVDPAASLEHRADYLFVHLDVAGEVAGYWRFVLEDALARAPSEPALMERQAAYGGGLARPSSELLAALADRHGPPTYRDHRLAVFRLR